MCGIYGKDRKIKDRGSGLFCLAFSNVFLRQIGVCGARQYWGALRSPPKPPSQMHFTQNCILNPSPQGGLNLSLRIAFRIIISWAGYLLPAAALGGFACLRSRQVPPNPFALPPCPTNSYLFSNARVKRGGFNPVYQEALLSFPRGGLQRG